MLEVRVYAQLGGSRVDLTDARHRVTSGGERWPQLSIVEARETSAAIRQRMRLFPVQCEIRPWSNGWTPRPNSVP